MRTILIALALTFILTGCGSPEELRAEKIAKLEQLRRETYADLIRQKAECQAFAVEFGGNTKIVATCLETLRMTVEMANVTVATIDKRLAEIERTGK